MLMSSITSANTNKSFFCNSMNGTLLFNTSSARFNDPTNFGFHTGETLVLEIGSMNASAVRLEAPQGQLAAVAYGATTIIYTIPEGGITSVSVSGIDGAFSGVLLCKTAVEAESISNNSGSAHDGRLNPAYGDLIGVVYFDGYLPGDPGLRLYEVTADGEGEFRCTVHQSDLTALDGESHNAPLPIDCGNRIQLYRLTTGELQVMLGPDAEGKSYVLIFESDSFEVTEQSTSSI
jgi:hypothetical protein